jgi:hypothetical protein
MKKVLLMAAVAGFMMTSCKKDYTCKCTDKDGKEVITYTAEMKKKDANTWCDSWHNTFTPSGGKCVLN